jgi:hypothetical protein
MSRVVDAEQLVDQIAAASCAALDELLRRTGAVYPPTVHILAEDLDQPWVGYLTCRRFRQGGDAAAALGELGELPSVLMATRLVVTWEAQDLNVALGAPMDPDDSALMVLDAVLGEVPVCRRYPFDARRPEQGPAAAIVARWRRPAEIRDPGLPGPVRRLLAVWRQWREADLDETVARLEAAGHRMHWAAR